MGQQETMAYLNTGIYSVSEAARLTGVSEGRIRRWLRGYHYKLRKEDRVSPPLWSGQLEPIDHKIALGFLDVVEVRFVDAFLKSGVSWTIIHKAREMAGARFPGESHPFCTRRFVTDGHGIFVELHTEAAPPRFLEIVRDQQVFAEIMRPFVKGLEFGEGNSLERWWPMGREQPVVIDPKRNFGQPTLAREGIPTSVLAKSVETNEGSVEEVADWYEISPESVKAAIRYEQSLTA
ncbi:MAG: hypothetical protein JWR69_2813 [Pedosphaera sp.]|nr:hypothetical protein [Pedosphaera sp.]